MCMLKLLQKTSQIKPVSVAFAIALVAITLVSLRFITGPNLAQKVIFSAVLLPILPSFFLVITGKSKSTLLQYTVRAVSVIVYLILGFLLLGILQDVSGEKCIGFFGAQESCLQHNVLLSLLSFEISPPFMLLALGILLALIIGLMDEVIKSIKSRR